MQKSNILPKIVVISMLSYLLGDYKYLIISINAESFQALARQEADDQFGTCFSSGGKH